MKLFLLVILFVVGTAGMMRYFEGKSFEKLKMKMSNQVIRDKHNF